MGTNTIKPPDGFVLDAGLPDGFVLDKPEPKRPPVASKGYDWPRAVALGSRALAEGALSPLLMAGDQIGKGPLIRELLGDKAPASPQEMFTNALDYYGAYKPGTKAERLGTNVVEAAAGNVVGGPAKFALALASAGGVGGAASGLTREAGGNPLLQFLAGLTGNLGAAGILRMGGNALRGVSSAVDRAFLPGGDVRGAATMLNEAAGKDKAAIVNEFKTGRSHIPGMPMDMGELAARTGNAEVPGLMELIRMRGGTPAGAFDKTQASALKSHSQTLSRSDNINARKEVIDDLNKRFGPQLQTAYDQANLGGTLGNQLRDQAESFRTGATNKVEDVRRFAAAGGRAEDMGKEFGRRSNPRIQKSADDAWIIGGQPTGMPSASGRYSYGQELADRAGNVVKNAADDSVQLGGFARDVQARADKIAAYGHNPLSGESLAARVESYLSKDGDRASDAVVSTMKPLAEKLRNLSDENGVISAANLHTIRKEIGEDIGANARAKGWSSGRTASVEMSVKNAIDDAMEQAGSREWRPWLTNFKEGMKNANDITIGGEIEKLLFGGKGEIRKAAVLRGIDNATKSPELMGRTGLARFGNLDQAMTGRGKAIKDDIVKFADDGVEVERLAKFGEKPAQKIIGAAYDPLLQVNFLNKMMTIANFGIRQLEGKGGDRSIAALTDMALNNPKALAAAMEKMSPAQKTKLFDYARQAGISQAGLLGM